jgi:hypothetical protein
MTTIATDATLLLLFSAAMRTSGTDAARLVPEHPITAA